MGVKFELNWYLVISDIKDITLLEENLFKVHKNEIRLYPIGAPIPFISKVDGCLGMVTIKELVTNEYNTDIVFTWESNTISEDIKNHYYSMYLDSQK